MFQKLYLTTLIGFGFLFGNTNDHINFKIVSNSNEKEDIEQMYYYKNEIINKYQSMFLAVNQNEVIEDLMKIYPELSYKNKTLIYVIGEGKGKSISGELKDDYCDVDVKPKSFLLEKIK